MVQRFAELQRIDQGPPVSVRLFQLVQAFAPDQESGYPAAIIPEPDLTQVTVLAQKERPSEYIRGLKAVHFQKITSFRPAPMTSGLIFVGRYDRKRKRFRGTASPGILSKAIN